MRDQVRLGRRLGDVRGAPAMTSAADVSGGGWDGSVHRPSFSILIGTAS